jgi:hypothetical protein
MKKYNTHSIRIIVNVFCTVALILILYLSVEYIFLSQDNGISANTAIEIAKKEIKKRETLNYEIECKAFRTQIGWSVTVYSLPKVPGGHIVIEISDKGEIKQIIPGR